MKQYQRRAKVIRPAVQIENGRRRDIVIIELAGGTRLPFLREDLRC